MSQNSNTLLLFFSKEEPYKKFYQHVKSLEAGKLEQAEKIASSLGLDISQLWNDDWFNHQIAITPKYIRLDFDTSTSSDLPFDLLQQLFELGLRAACLEVFHDQVGEFSQFFFMDNKLVDFATICKKYSLIKTIVGEQFEEDNEALEQHAYNMPSPIGHLIKQQVEAKDTASEMVEAFVELAKDCKETGQNPIEAVKSLLILRAAGKGLLQGIGFGLITVLLFKGLWLWICLAIVLTVILPLVYMNQVSAEFDDDESNENDGEESLC